MTLKLIDLFEIKYISTKNIPDRELINTLKVHDILNIHKEIRNQYILMVSSYFKDLLVIHIFKKFFNRDRMWTSNKLQYINSFCITKNIDNPIHWNKVDKEGDKLDDDYFMLDETYDRSILTEDYEFYIKLKGKYNFFTPEDEIELQSKIWGKKYHTNSIIWQVILSNSIISIYGSGIEDLHFRCKDFVYGNLKNIYFKNYNQESLVFKKFVDNKIVYCDYCQESSKIIKNRFYHHYNYGDICSNCFRMKKNKEEYRKDYFIRYIKSVGRRNIFKKEVEKTKKFLSENEVKELSDKKKYELMLKINKSICKKVKRNECSVCLEEMTDNIYAGSCGHCLHAACYFKLESSQCPVCRKVGTFKKLHL